MSIPNITALYWTEQLDLLYTHGVFLAKRGSGHRAVFLLQFKDWYVEIHYRKYRQDINEILFFKDTSVLDPYLDQIDVDEILSVAR